MKTVKIGFGYKARRGKDTAVKAIVKTIGGAYYARRYAFADELRNEIKCAVFDRWVEDRREEPFDPLSSEPMRHLCAWAGVPFDPEAEVSAEYPFGKQRRLYQWWGEWRRLQDPDYWVKRVAERIELEGPVFALLSDVRYFNEFDFCDYRIRMDRPGFEIEDGAAHVSEVQLDVLPAERWSAVITATRPEEVERQAMIEFYKIRRAVNVLENRRYMGRA